MDGRDINRSMRIFKGTVDVMLDILEDSGKDLESSRHMLIYAVNAVVEIRREYNRLKTESAPVYGKCCYDTNESLTNE